MSAAGKSERVPFYSWYALAVLFLVYLVNFVDRQILSILANDIKTDLHIGDAELGFLYGTAFAIFYALFGIPLGRLADNWSRTRLLAIGLALWSAMTMLSGAAKGAVALAAARVGVGVGEATASPCAYSLIADWFPPRLRATALGIYSSGLFLGSGLSLLIGGAVVERWNAAWPAGGPLGLVGWQAAFLVVGVPGLILAGWVLTLHEPPRGGPDSGDNKVSPTPVRDFLAQMAQIVPPFPVVTAARRGPHALGVNLLVAGIIAAAAFVFGLATANLSQFVFVGVAAYAVFSWATALRAADRATFRLTWGTPAFVAIVLAYAAVAFVGYTVSYWAAPYAERTFGLDKVQLGWLLGAPAAVGGFLGVLTGGWLADRLNRWRSTGRLWVMTIALVAPVPIVALGYSTSSAPVFVGCSFLVQVATSSALSAAAAASQSLVLPHMRGTATAIFFLGATLIGLAFGPFGAGFVSEATGSLATGVIATLAIVPVGLAALALAMTRYDTALQSATARASNAIGVGVSPTIRPPEAAGGALQ
jgi:MFS family permease